VAGVVFLPSIIVAPAAAMFGDRWPRARVLAGAYAVLSLAMAATAVALVVAPPIVAYAMATLAATSITLVRPAHAALLPEVVQTPDELAVANAASGTVEGLGALLGPLVAGLLVGLAGPAAVYGAIAVLTLGSTLAVLPLARVAPLLDVATAVSRTSGFMRELGAGLRTVVGDRRLFAVTLMGLLAEAIGSLERARVPYMITGSIASTYHDEPRSTRDIDVVIDPDAVGLERLVDELVAAFRRRRASWAVFPRHVVDGGWPPPAGCRITTSTDWYGSARAFEPGRRIRSRSRRAKIRPNGCDSDPAGKDFGPFQSRGAVMRRSRDPPEPSTTSSVITARPGISRALDRCARTDGCLDARDRPSERGPAPPTARGQTRRPLAPGLPGVRAPMRWRCSSSSLCRRCRPGTCRSPGPGCGRDCLGTSHCCWSWLWS